MLIMRIGRSRVRTVEVQIKSLRFTTIENL